MKEFIENHVPKALIQFVGFGIVGGINTVLSWLIVNGCFYYLHIHYQISNIIGFVITVFISFLLNRNFVFKKSEAKENETTDADSESVARAEADIATVEKQAPWYLELLKVYASYAFTGIVLQYFLLNIEQERLGIPLYIATVLNLVVTIPINFIMNKFWAYRNKE